MKGELGKKFKGLKDIFNCDQSQPTSYENVFEMVCQIFVVQVGYSNSKNKTLSLENMPIIQEFTDVFPEEILGLPPAV